MWFGHISWHDITPLKSLTPKKCRDWNYYSPFSTRFTLRPNSMFVFKTSDWFSGVNQLFDQKSFQFCDSERNIACKKSLGKWGLFFHKHVWKYRAFYFQSKRHSQLPIHNICFVFVVSLSRSLWIKSATLFGFNVLYFVVANWWRVFMFRINCWRGQHVFSLIWIYLLCYAVASSSIR